MRTIIAGSRGIDDYRLLLSSVKSCGWKITTVMSGNARGVDRLGELYALRNRVLLERYPADWKRHGVKAGYVRNLEMASIAEGLVAIWDGSSRGTKHMIETANKLHLAVYIVTHKT